jgi:hypothetical protein
VNYKRVSAVAQVPHIYFLKSLNFFPHRGSPQGCEVFNKVELMYPKASIKLRSPKKSHQTRVKTANEVSCKFNKRFTQNIGAMNRGVLSDASFIGSFKRPWIKKEGPRKTQRGSFKRPPMKKEAPRKMQRGSFKRPPLKKEALCKTQRGSFKRPPMKKEAPCKT